MKDYVIKRNWIEKNEGQGKKNSGNAYSGAEPSKFTFSKTGFPDGAFRNPGSKKRN